MLTAREAWKVMQNARREAMTTDLNAWRIANGMRRKTIEDDDPAWEQFLLEYHNRKWTEEQDNLLSKLIDRVVEETRIYPPEQRPCARKIFMCVFNMVK